MKVALGLHDFSVVNNRLLWLLTLKDKFPKFKVSLFTVPVDEKNDWGSSTIRGEYLKEIKKNLSWMQIIPHGLDHDKSEMQYCRDFESVMVNIKRAFETDGLPYEKGFCAPHWRWSQEVVDGLNEAGWWGAVDPRQPDMIKPKKFYRYSHTIDNIDYSQELLKLHGHIYGTKNDLGLCFDNLLKLPADTEWHYVTDFLEGI